MKQARSSVGIAGRVEWASEQVVYLAVTDQTSGCGQRDLHSSTGTLPDFTGPRPIAPSIAAERDPATPPDRTWRPAWWTSGGSACSPTGRSFGGESERQRLSSWERSCRLERPDGPTMCGGGILDDDLVAEDLHQSPQRGSLGPGFSECCRDEQLLTGPTDQGNPTLLRRPADHKLDRHSYCSSSGCNQAGHPPRRRQYDAGVPMVRPNITEIGGITGKASWDEYLRSLAPWSPGPEGPVHGDPAATYDHRHRPRPDALSQGERSEAQGSRGGFRSVRGCRRPPHPAPERTRWGHRHRIWH